MQRPRCPHCQHYEVEPLGTLSWHIGINMYIQTFKCRSCSDTYYIHLLPKEIHYEEKTASVLLLEES